MRTQARRSRETSVRMFKSDQQTQHENVMLDVWAGCQDSGKSSRGTVCTWLRPGRTSSATALSVIIVIDFSGRLYLYIVDTWAGSAAMR
jgi:hypothetical protein